MIRRATSLLLLSGGAAISGCDNTISDVETISRNAAETWTKAAAASGQASPSKGTLSGGYRLHIDASRSMAGFAGCTARATRFNTLLDRLASDLAITQVVRFGERQGGTNAFEHLPLSRAVHCAAFFDRLQNPDFALYRAAFADTTGDTFLYVTDGVQSDWLGPNPGPSIGALKDWLQAGRALAILAFTSEFDGPAWSERRQRMNSRVSTSDRPFYLFVLAQKDSEIDALLRRLSSSVVAQAQLIRFGADRVLCTTGPARRLPKYRHTSNPPWAMVSHDAIERTDAIVNYRCEIPPEYPLGSIRPRVSMTYQQWNGKAFGEPTDLLPGTSIRMDSVAVLDGGSETVLEGVLPFDNAARFGIYHLRLDPDPGALRTEIQTLSTDSDADPETFDKTYRFSWMIEQLVRTDLARQPWSPLSLTVQYR